MRGKNEPMTQLEDLVMRELTEMNTQPSLQLGIPRVTVYMLISQCQLAFRHPSNTGKSRQVIGELVEGLRRLICEPGSAVDLSIKMGYEEQFDFVRVDQPRADPPN